MGPLPTNTPWESLQHSLQRLKLKNKIKISKRAKFSSHDPGQNAGAMQEHILPPSLNPYELHSHFWLIPPCLPAIPSQSHLLSFNGFRGKSLTSKISPCQGHQGEGLSQVPREGTSTQIPASPGMLQLKAKEGRSLPFLNPAFSRVDLGFVCLRGWLPLQKEFTWGIPSPCP